MILPQVGSKASSGFAEFLSYFFVKKIPSSRHVEYVMDGSIDQ